MKKQAGKWIPVSNCETKKRKTSSPIPAKIHSDPRGERRLNSKIASWLCVVSESTVLCSCGKFPPYTNTRVSRIRYGPIVVEQLDLAGERVPRATTFCRGCDNRASRHEESARIPRISVSPGDLIGDSIISRPFRVRDSRCWCYGRTAARGGIAVKRRAGGRDIGFALTGKSTAAARMGSKVEYVESSHMYATNYIRNSKAIGVLWGIFTICYAIIGVVAFVTPEWLGDLEHENPGRFGLWTRCSYGGNGTFASRLLFLPDARGAFFSSVISK